jgi:transglutaminase-like putative cysteine protease
MNYSGNIIVKVFLTWIGIYVFFTGSGTLEVHGNPQETNSQARIKSRNFNQVPSTRGRINEVNFQINYAVFFAERTESANVILSIPDSLPDRQKIYDLQYSQPPERTWQKNEIAYADFRFDNSKKQHTLRIAGKVDLYRYDLDTAIAQGPRALPENPDVSKYLLSEPHLECDAEPIRQMADQIAAGNQVELVKKIHQYVASHLKYVFIEDSRGALWAARSGRGDCNEYSSLFVALCRAKRIPARLAFGYSTSWTNTPRHVWAEVYLNEYGWVPFDPSYNKHPASDPAKLKPIYFYLSRDRSNPIAQGGFEIRFAGDRPIVTQTFTVNDQVIDAIGADDPNERKFLDSPLYASLERQRRIFELGQKLRNDPLDIKTAQELARLREQQQLDRQAALKALILGLRAYQADRYIAAARWLEKAIQSPQVQDLACTYLTTETLEQIRATCHQRNTQALCPVCGGTLRADCSACKGTGFVLCPECKGRGEHRHPNFKTRPPGYRGKIPTVPCPTCKGLGQVQCSSCRGYGTVECERCSTQSAAVDQQKTKSLNDEIQKLSRAVRYFQAGGIDLNASH